MTRINKRQTSLSIFGLERRASVLINLDFCSVKICRQQTMERSLSGETPNLDNLKACSDILRDWGNGNKHEMF